MAEAKINYSELPEKVEKKIKRREIKKEPKMRVSGKRVFQLKNIIKK
jgi:hypothetical protein